MTGGLEGRTALVTGGGKGIGRAVCKELSAMGGAVALAGATIWNGRTGKRQGVALIVAYGIVVAGFLAAGNR